MKDLTLTRTRHGIYRVTRAGTLLGYLNDFGGGSFSAFLAGGFCYGPATTRDAALAQLAAGRIVPAIITIS